MVGNFINKNFVGVTAKDLSNFNKLPLFAFCFSFISYLFLPLIPSTSQINKWKKERDIQEDEDAIDLNKTPRLSKE